jgi:hypothetical protein
MIFFLPATSAAMTLVMTPGMPAAPQRAKVCTPPKRTMPADIFKMASQKTGTSPDDFAHHGPAGLIVTCTRRGILFATTAITKMARTGYSFFSRVLEALALWRMVEAMSAFARAFTPFGYQANTFWDVIGKPHSSPASALSCAFFRLPAPHRDFTRALPSPAMFEPVAYRSPSSATGRATIEQQVQAVVTPFAVMAFAVTSALVQTAPQIAAAFGA